MDELMKIMARLRAKDGCPWDIQQTHQSLKRYLIEEAYEFLDAVDSGDENGMKEELGDLLLQVVFHAQLASERGAFDMQDVCQGIAEKMRRRHPHVFASARAENAGVVEHNWHEIKRREKGEEARTISGIPSQLPALYKAEKIQKKAASRGFDWTDIRDVIAKIREELQEVEEVLEPGREDELENELGDLLFATVNLCRFRKIDPEAALNRANQKFIRRFNGVEDRVAESGRDWKSFTLTELDQFWDAVKMREKGRGGSAAPKSPDTP